MEPYQRLSDAIILQAVENYRAYRKTLGWNPNDKAAQAGVAEVDEFFRSEWFKQLTDIDGEKLLKRLRDESR